MQFNTHTLPETLSPWIESIFHFEGFMPDHSIERVVPTGHLFIIFELDGMLRHTYDNVSLEPNGNYSKVWVSGMHKNYLSISAHPNSEMLVIQCKSSGSYPIIKKPIQDLNNRVVPAEELFGDQILTLQEQLLEAADSTAKFKIVEDWILNQFDESLTPNVDLVGVLEQLKVQPVHARNSVLAQYPHSQKHLINQFKKYFGLTPKVFHRIFRFNELLKAIQQQQQQSLNWAEIAYEFGYTDQSHFIKEFKEFSGFNPGEFIKADHHRDQPNFFPLDRDG